MTDKQDIRKQARTASALRAGWDSQTITLQSGEPCCHRGCERHTTHPCEVCGRLNAIGEASVLRKDFLKAKMNPNKGDR